MPECLFLQLRRCLHDPLNLQAHCVPQVSAPALCWSPHQPSGAPNCPCNSPSNDHTSQIRAQPGHNPGARYLAPGAHLPVGTPEGWVTPETKDFKQLSRVQQSWLLEPAKHRHPSASPSETCQLMLEARLGLDTCHSTERDVKATAHSP